MGMKGEDGGPKEKSQSQIQEEQEAVKVKFEEKYVKAGKDEKRLLETTLNLISQKSQGPALETLKDKVQLLCGQF